MADQDATRHASDAVVCVAATAVVALHKCTYATDNRRRLESPCCERVIPIFGASEPEVRATWKHAGDGAHQHLRAAVDGDHLHVRQAVPCFDEDVVVNIWKITLITRTRGLKAFSMTITSRLVMRRLWSRERSPWRCSPKEEETYLCVRNSDRGRWFLVCGTPFTFCP